MVSSSFLRTKRRVIKRRDEPMLTSLSMRTLGRHEWLKNDPIPINAAAWRVIAGLSVGTDSPGSLTPITLDPKVSKASRIHPAESAGSVKPHAEEISSQILMMGPTISAAPACRRPSVIREKWQYGG